MLLKSSVLVVGPSSRGLKGGQATHMENINKAFESESDIALSYFYSSSGLEKTEGFFLKFIRFLHTITTFPFCLFNKDIIHINSSFDIKANIRDLFLICWSTLFNKKTVIQYHGGNPYKLNVLNNLFIRKIYLFLWRRSKVLILNNVQADWFEEFTDIVPLRLKNYVSVPNKFKNHINKIYRFTYLGRIIKEKGLIEIVDAAESLKSSYRFEVEIYGAGEDFTYIEKYIKRNDMCSIVKLKGPIEPEHKNDVLYNSDSFLYPSYYPEGLPYAVLEALSYGLPVICTNAGALEYVVKDGDTCLKVKDKSSVHLAEKMKLLMDDHNIYTKLSNNAKALIEENYSLNAMKQVFKGVWHG